MLTSELCKRQLIISFTSSFIIIIPDNSFAQSFNLGRSKPFVMVNHSLLHTTAER